MKILAIESSCDETAAAVVENGRSVFSNVIASQVEQHIIYGGVVPEIASRLHAEAISGVVDTALKQAGVTLEEIDAVAVTFAPGLIGALLVGVNFAKGLALSAGKPLIPVHHLRGHIAANYITFPDLKPPFLCLVVSGGHSHIVAVEDYTSFKIIGKTRDDAAGECLDKAARTMGLNYPGGLNLDKLAAGGDAAAFSFPRPKVEGAPFDFSFSGLKTNVINLIHNAEQKGIELNQKDLGASFINAVTNLLCENTLKAAKEFGFKKIVLAGGVSANSVLRKKMDEGARLNGYEIYYPELKYCGDNAAMIGAQAYYEYQKGNTAGYDLNAVATMPIDDVRYE
ncbi:MAG: tRNA (adenosine(37)-N6)-threonylcarbamoyltransferase complex transferase subunit TsaD [Clostridia bacterium]|nr:tRNA (adenosine(37)-N6)-threonylcarbamoyltransferase complex transferase subunit TsaD [Clostridia bacterium]